MPVTEQLPVISHNGNGVTTVFSYNFKILDERDLEVTIDGAVKTLTTDYSVSGVGVDGGGSVTMVTAPASGTENVVLRRAMAYDRSNDYQENGDLLASTADEDADRPIMLLQQLNADLVRSLKLPVGTTSSQEIAESSIDRAGKVLAFDASGNLIVAVPGDLAITIDPALYRAKADDVNLSAGKVIVFEGATDNTFETTLTVADPTADRTITLPDKSGTVAMTSDIPAVTATPPVRQTVLSASVDTSGLPNFMSGIGTTTLTIAGSAGTPFIATAANGFSATGPVDRIGSSTANLTLAGQNTNGTYYAYVDIAANGTLTLGASSLAPTYPAGGAYSTTNGQFQFNYLGEMVGKLGNGSTAAQAYRVYIGEFTVAANVIATVTPYALMGRYTSGLNAIPGSGTATVMNHNLGVQPMHSKIVIACQTAELGYAVGDEVSAEILTNVGTNIVASVAVGAKSSTYTYFAATPYLNQKGSAAIGAITTANWKIKSYASRGW